MSAHLRRWSSTVESNLDLAMGSPLRAIWGLPEPTEVQRWIARDRSRPSKLSPASQRGGSAGSRGGMGSVSGENSALGKESLMMLHLRYSGGSDDLAGLT